MDKIALQEYLKKSMEWAEGMKQKVLDDPLKVRFWDGQKAAFDMVLETVKNESI